MKTPIACLAACLSLAAHAQGMDGMDMSHGTPMDMPQGAHRDMPQGPAAASPPADAGAADNRLLPRSDTPATTRYGQQPLLATDGDRHLHGASLSHQVLVDQLEYTHGRDAEEGLAWDVQAWYGGDHDKLWLKSEGERQEGTSDGRAEALWSHAFAAFWDWQLGVRHDFGSDADRQWLAFGVQGTAPGWYEVEAAAYLGPNGRSALRAKVENEWLITQRLILVPELEANAYGKDDSSRSLGRGLSDASFGLRLHYAISPAFAPYVGVEWTRRFGDTADYAEAAGDHRSETQWLTGLRFWF